jgi:hypothetical protein
MGEANALDPKHVEAGAASGMRTAGRFPGRPPLQHTPLMSIASFFALSALQ